MNTLVVLNDPPYGTERSYNALRLAGALLMFQHTAVGICGSSLDARGIKETELLDGTQRSSLEELAD